MRYTVKVVCMIQNNYSLSHMKDIRTVAKYHGRANILHLDISYDSGNKTGMCKSF